MNYLELIFGVFFIVLLIIWFFLYFGSMINSFRYKVPQVWTFSSDFKVLRKWLWKYNLKWKTIADLWSGSWKVLRFFEKEFWMISTWYEIDFSNVLYSKFLNFIFKSKSKVIKWNYLKKDLSKYDVFYIYWFKVIMPGIEKKLWWNCKKGTLIISNAFKMPTKQPLDILVDKNWKEEVYIYKI